jgi:hypothetical protein
MTPLPRANATSPGDDVLARAITAVTFAFAMVKISMPNFRIYLASSFGSEGFQIDKTGTQVFVNVPDARGIEVVDLATGSTRALPTPGAGSNFPMAIDGEAHRVLVVFRSPPILMALFSQDGNVAAKVETCGDADDVFVDTKRHRVYVSCGEGVIDVLEPGEPGYRRLARVPTVSGARASLFVPELDRLFVAVRAASNEPAAIWVFRPTP